MRKQLLMTEVPAMLMISQQQAPLNLVPKTFTTSNYTAPSVEAAVNYTATDTNVRPSSLVYFTQPKQVL